MGEVFGEMKRHYHFVGIGGIGMGALASLLLAKGKIVSGSDLKENQVTEKLKAQGARIFVGHDARHMEGADVVIYTSAVQEHNPELAAAKARHVPVLQRAVLLAELMKSHTGITVAGAHGKTTTTSMIAGLLMKAGLNPTVAIGGIVNGSACHAQLGGGEYFVAEVDESDGSFLHFAPKVSVITNIDYEHLDYYHNWENILSAYRAFIHKTTPDGLVLVRGDDERLMRLVEESGRSFKTFGFLPRHNITARNIQFDHFHSRFECVIDGKSRGEVQLVIPGRHNVANALACIGTGLTLSIDFDVIRESLKEFQGVQRRFQVKGKIDNIWVIYDYAHHPTEIEATLQTAQVVKRSGPGMEGERRLIAVFQPHRYSRLQALMDEFARSLTTADYLIVTDVYAASEKPIEGISAETLCDKIREKTEKPVFYVKKENVVDDLLSAVHPGDFVMTLGAGDISSMTDHFVSALKESVEKKSKVKLEGIKV